MAQQDSVGQQLINDFVNNVQTMSGRFEQQLVIEWVMLPGDTVNAEQDPLYDQAVTIVIETRRASISGVQRRLKIGYNRAARMVESMEQAGLVGPLQSNGSREILLPATSKE